MAFFPRSVSRIAIATTGILSTLLLLVDTASAETTPPCSGIEPSNGLSFAQTRMDQCDGNGQFTFPGYTPEQNSVGPGMLSSLAADALLAHSEFRVAAFYFGHQS